MVGAVEHVRARAEMPVHRPGWDRYERDRTILMSRLGDPAFAAAMDKGYKMTEGEIVELVERIGS